MVLFQRDLWVPPQTGGIWCLSGGGLCQLVTDNLLRVIIYSFVQNTCREQCHVFLDSHLTKPWLPCVAMSKTAAIYVRWQHIMCPRPAVWDQEGLPFRQKHS